MKIVIPARYASSRLPGKPLADIAGKPMLQHVWERACEAAGDGDDVIIAADDNRIITAVEAFGAKVMKTAETHESGTDRIAEVAQALDWAGDEIVVNLQGDEPLMPPLLVQQVADALKGNPAAALATASCSILRAEDVENPNIVKVVTDGCGAALYFSRSSIPHDRSGTVDTTRYDYQRHIGLYAYRVDTLARLTKLPPTQLEQLEQLEQLRALTAGMQIIVLQVPEAPPHGVDTSTDLAVMRAHFAGRS